MHTLRITQPGSPQNNSTSQNEDKGTEEDQPTEQIDISHDKSPITDAEKKVFEQRKIDESILGLQDNPGKKKDI